MNERLEISSKNSMSE
jgi:hypothetical protein